MRGLRVLVVEDDCRVASFLVHMLVGMGFEICPVIAASEAEVVTQAARCRPELVIIDVRVRNQRVIAAVEKILCNESMPHIFLSGDPSGVHAFTPGAVVLQEPFRQSDLARAIHRALGFTAVFSGAKRPQVVQASDGR